MESPSGERHSFEWQTGSLFAIPLNASYRHYNGSGAEPARFVAVRSGLCNTRAQVGLLCMQSSGDLDMSFSGLKSIRRVYADVASIHDVYRRSTLALSEVRSTCKSSTAVSTLRHGQPNSPACAVVLKPDLRASR